MGVWQPKPVNSLGEMKIASGILLELCHPGSVMGLEIHRQALGNKPTTSSIAVVGKVGRPQRALGLTFNTLSWLLSIYCQLDTT